MKEIIRRFEQLLWEEDAPTKDSALKLYQALDYMISSAESPTPKVEVLRNDCSVQAIRLPDGSVMAVFHRPKTLAVADKSLTHDAGTILC